MKIITLKIKPLCLILLIGLIGHSQSTARYTISFTSTWNSTDHGTLPVNAHWSDLVGATHNNSVTFWAEFQLATLGLENVAETGTNVDFNNEVDAAIAGNNADQWLQAGFSPFAAISTATLSDVIVSMDYPLLTLVSMIAPSPDWFIGVNSFSLLDGGNNWKANVSIDLFPYDAGTEEGTTYSTMNSPSSPHQNVFSRVNMTPFNDQKIGTMTMTLEEVLGLDPQNFESAISIFPNPATEEIHIKLNNQNALPDHMTIFNMLGQEILTNNIQDAGDLAVDISSFNNGMYILKIQKENRVKSFLFVKK